MEGRCYFKENCRNSHEPTPDESEKFRKKQDERTGHRRMQDNNKNNGNEGRSKRGGNGKDAEEEVSELVNGFKHLTKQMHFLEEKIQKISRFTAGKRKM